LHLSYSASQVAAITGGELKGNDNLQFTLLTTDTRRPGFPPDTLFVALAGYARTGEQFIAEYYQSGGRVFMTQHLPEQATSMQDAAFIIVANALSALQQLAIHHRNTFDGTMIGITGSNGKTVVKEWLYQCLRESKKLVRNPRSYNSQIGVPLSVWLLQPQHELAIIEAGISKPGEMKRLANIIQPGIGVLTNIGAAHDEGFSSRHQKLLEKLQLFDNSTEILARWQDKAIGAWPPAIEAKTKFWGQEEDCDFRIDAKMTGQQTEIGIWEKQNAGSSWKIKLAYTDAASVENGITTALTLRLLGLAPEHISEMILRVHPIDMRMTLMQGVKGCSIINDSYSHDEYALTIALDYWRQQSRGRRSIILGDPGNEQADIARLPELLRREHLYRAIFVGEGFSNIILPQDLAEKVHVYNNTADLLADFPSLDFEGETILVKGPRRLGFEKIVSLLADNRHETWLEINLDAMRQNLVTYQAMLKADTKIMVMIKAFGYGSGDAEVARMLEHAGVHYLGVAYPNEGIALRKAGVKLPIMVLNSNEDSFPQLEQWNLEPEIFSFDILGRFLRFCSDAGLSGYPIHLKVDTGMHRLGFLPEEVAELGEIIKATDVIRIKSVFSHFIASESPAADEVSAVQIEGFIRFTHQLTTITGQHFVRHMANSHAIRRLPEAHFDMVRLGISLYGGSLDAQPVLRLVTTVAQVKRVKKGETVGYGLGTVMSQDTTIAVLRIGYADGLPRRLGKGRWHCQILGKEAPIVGNVCMDMTMVDISAIHEVKPGDEAEVFGPNQPIVQMAAAADTIIYELMTGISQRVPRRYIRE